MSRGERKAMIARRSPRPEFEPTVPGSGNQPVGVLLRSRRARALRTWP